MLHRVINIDRTDVLLAQGRSLQIRPATRWAIITVLLCEQILTTFNHIQFHLWHSPHYPPSFLLAIDVVCNVLTTDIKCYITHWQRCCWVRCRHIRHILVPLRWGLILLSARSLVHFVIYLDDVVWEHCFTLITMNPPLESTSLFDIWVWSRLTQVDIARLALTDDSLLLLLLMLEQLPCD